METRISNFVVAKDFWELSRQLPILDVRSPGEFRQGHIPGATNVPLFSDKERAEIGTAYKKQGRQPAVRIGLKYVSPRMVDLVDAAIERAVDNEVLIHCWRGGMRSQTFAQILELAELKPIVLSGGYKSFRNLAQSTFARPLPLVVVSGLTGAGKTEVLNQLLAAGEQIIDLEGLAHHRGSAFGGIGQSPQPTTEQFENCLFQTIEKLDPNRTVWIEDEGNRIGSVVVPNGLHDSLRLSPAVEIHCSLESRVKNLVVDYGDLEPARLAESIGRIRKRLGGLATQQAITAVEAGSIGTAIEIVLAYYDKTYNTAIRTMPRETTVRLDVDGLSDAELVGQLQELATGLAIKV